MPRRTLRPTRRRFGLPAALLATLLAGALLAAAPGAATASAVRALPAAAADYCGGQCDDILPPGENGNATLADILANKVFGTRPAHTEDQLGPYSALSSGYPGLTNDQLSSFFNDASFGVPANQVASSISPRSDVTIVRDKATGVPHVTGTTRYGTEYGAGYAAAQDRLWVMDLFRHVGRGELSGFAGGAAANRQLEQSFWQAAPYTEDELQQQINTVANDGPRGQQALSDAQAYVDGINAYITQAYNNRTFPGEYDLTGHVNAITNAGSIQPFQLTDLVALASVIGALFGSGGGGQVQSAMVKEAADARYGTALGDQVWQSLREANDPEAVTTLHDGQSFPYALPPTDPQGTAMPDPGSVVPEQLIYNPTGSATSSTTKAAGVLPGDLLTAKHGMSNALLVSGKDTASGNPVAVFGPQTGYFAPQLLMLEELQGPGISARGAAFAGLSFYVELGRGQDYAWSATSAGQNITDTYAVPLCTTDGSPVTLAAQSYLYHGTCTPFDKLVQQDAWSPTTADSTPAGSYSLVMYRSDYGLVTSRGTVGGKPVAFTSLRSSYDHEVDSIIGFQMLNDPGSVHDPASFQQAAQNINYTFNWFYADSKHIAYYNSGDNPVRAPGVDAGLPVMAQPAYEWQGFDPSDNTAQYTPPAQHPQGVDQDYYISWNNKQAQDYGAAGFGDGSVHRANLLDARVKALVAKGGVTRASLTQAMEDAAVTDLRGEDVLPDLLKVIGTAPVTDPQLAPVVQELQAWQVAGSKRVETSAGSHAYANAAAVQVMDAWWPLVADGVMHPGLGDQLFTALTGALQINESPSGGQTGPVGGGSVSANESIPHKGSSFQYGWWSYLDKDLRSVLGEPVAGPLAQQFCGGGDLTACRTVLLTTLKQAAAESAAQVYPGDGDCAAGDQWCADTIIQRPLGGVTDDKITWQNRPTYQQVVEFPSHR
ncbi:penicillin acylase family protein [Kitasatospora sp. NBC_01287]|uniref:penicillin acylase family protein n=1 Tax=Kitasatospora sp. NBC_01287 TaxID=2903573 RepID=UPI00224E36C2|nr:penicillin acylase family protein [Kitasatospora sp. NBC_01287]MCX4749357.1 penicillin acylase family protein [Kitasatospora sp. NBC_01287]